MNSRYEWFAMLAALAYPADRNRAQAAFQPYLPWFNDLPNEAFTRASLEAVVTSPRRMAIPSYDEIRRPLAAWWRENRSAEVRLESDYPRLEAPAPRGEPTPEEVAVVAETVRALKAGHADAAKAERQDERLRPVPKPLSDGWLLAQYEAVAADERLPNDARRAAATRAAMLRAALYPVPEEFAHAAE